MRAIDWIGRVFVLVLSTLATLSIVASLVSLSAPATPEPRRDGAVEMAVPPPERSATAPLAEPNEPPASDAAGIESIQTADARHWREIARWLRALTYAVLGLAGFVAVLVIVAMRATAHLGAIADRR